MAWNVSWHPDSTATPSFKLFSRAFTSYSMSFYRLSSWRLLLLLLCKSPMVQTWVQSALVQYPLSDRVTEKPLFNHCQSILSCLCHYYARLYVLVQATMKNNPSWAMLVRRPRMDGLEAGYTFCISARWNSTNECKNKREKTTKIERHEYCHDTDPLYPNSSRL